MSQFRVAALLSLLGAAGCYREAPTQSTLPSDEPYYVSGPPGGSMDAPDDAYRTHGAYREQPSGAAADQAPSDPGADPGPADAEPDDYDDGDGDAAALGPAEAAPAPAEAAPAPDAIAGALPEEPGGAMDPEPAPEPQTIEPTGEVTDPEIEATLDGYGEWIETADYGQVWRPDATVVGGDFTPYVSNGSWQYTDAGWAFACNYNWGWLPFHYGQWAWFHDYWAWVPGYQWAPAWVDWRHGDGVVGWRPMRPLIRDHRHRGLRDHRFGGGRPVIRDHRRAEQHDGHWRFTRVSDFHQPRIRSHLYRDLSDGMRRTRTVTAPPVRARTVVPASDLMRSRIDSPRRAMHPGRGVAPSLRDHRGVAPRTYPGSGIERVQPVRPGRAAPPFQTSRPSLRGQEPARTYQPPARTYQPPARTYQRPGRTYPPPARTYPGPARTYQPPVRTYQPPARTYQPPARTYQAPVRTYQPPARTYQAPARTYQAPARTYQAPVRTYQAPPRASAPARSSSPSTRVGGSGRTSSPATTRPSGHRR